MAFGKNAVHARKIYELRQEQADDVDDIDGPADGRDAEDDVDEELDDDGT